MFNQWNENRKERAAFRRKVEEETLPVRRAAYLKARIEQASEEGSMIANKEFNKQKQAQQQRDSDDPFGLKNPLKFINKQEDKKNGK